MDLQIKPLVSYELLSLPMKIAQMQNIQNQRLLDMTITNKVEAILEFQKNLDILA